MNTQTVPLRAPRARKGSAAQAAKGAGIRQTEALLARLRAAIVGPDGPESDREALEAHLDTLELSGRPLTADQREVLAALVTETAENHAAAINGVGVRAQVKYLTDHGWTRQSITVALDQA